jgi:Protein of unknown function (DUF3102)
VSKHKSVVPSSPELDEHAAEIIALGRRSFADIVEIGRRLVRCRELLKTQRCWLAWIKTKFGWSRTHADNLIGLYEARDKLQKFGTLLPVSTLYSLAKQDPEVIQRIAYRVEAGEPATARAVKVIVREEVREVRSIGYAHEGPSPKERAAQRFLQELRVLVGCLLPGMTPDQIAAAVPPEHATRTADTARRIADFLHELSRRLGERAPLELVASSDTKH